MTREEALALCHPIRASVRRILSAAISGCNRSEFIRAAKLLGLGVDGTISLPEGDQAAEMLSDIVLFEPNRRGRRASAATTAAFGVRLFDAGEFHVGFGIAVPSDEEETTEFSIEATCRKRPDPTGDCCRFATLPGKAPSLAPAPRESHVAVHNGTRCIVNVSLE